MKKDLREKKKKKKREKEVKGRFFIRARSHLNSQGRISWENLDLYSVAIEWRLPAHPSSSRTFLACSTSQSIHSTFSVVFFQW